LVGIVLQASRSQNIWGTVPGVVPVPIGRVLEGVAKTEIVMARRTLQAPDVSGTYLVDALNDAGATRGGIRLPGCFKVTS
jgi:hypothetical protein